MLNVCAPSSADVRVIKYVVQVIPQVRGRVIEVPVEPNRPVKKGTVLFRIDPTPFEFAGAGARSSARRGGRLRTQLDEELRAARAGTESVRAKLELARMRVRQNRELASTGAGDRFALEAGGDNCAGACKPQLRSSVAEEAQVRAHLGATVGDDQAEIADIKAQLARARWELSQTVFYAPADGTVINLQLRPGQMATALGQFPVMTFVENEFQVIALFSQNELHQVRARR